MALLASVLLLDNLTLTIAVRAHGLKPLDHGSHLTHHGLHTVAITARAAPNGALLAASTGTLRADDRTLKGQLGNLALVDILQGDLVRVVDGARLGGSPILHPAEHTAHAAKGTAASEELREQVLGSHAAAASTPLETSLAILIVDRALLRIRENLICGRNILELLFGVGVVLVLVYYVLGEGFYRKGGTR